MLATTGVDGFLKVWDPSNGALLTEVSGVGVAEGTSFSEDGKLAAAAWPDEGAVHVVKLSTDRVVRTFEDLRSANGTSFGPGGTRIAVSRKFPDPEGGTTGEILLLDLQNNRRRSLLDPHTGRQVDDVAWSPDGDLLASGSDTLMVWDAESGERLYSVPGSTGMITSLDWWEDPSSRVLVTGADDGTAKVWSILAAGPKETVSLSSPEVSNVTGVAFSPDGTRVMIGNDVTSPGIKIWDVSAAGDAEWVNLPADSSGSGLLPVGAARAGERRRWWTLVWLGHPLGRRCGHRSHAGFGRSTGRRGTGIAVPRGSARAPMVRRSPSRTSPAGGRGTWDERA